MDKPLRQTLLFPGISNIDADKFSGGTMIIDQLRRKSLGAVMATGLVAVFALMTISASPLNAQEDEIYGYYEVIGAGALNIRERPYTSSPVLAVAERGEVLAKWRRYCSLRPWCPVQKGDVQGWAGKDYLEEVEPDYEDE